MTDLPAVRLKDLLRYCLDTGRLFWLERHEGDFSHCKNPQGQASAWNAKYAEREAFTATDGQGYKSGAIFGKTYTAHRVIWALVSGEWPDQEIDHADKVRTNNRWNNLRLASHGENARNRDVQANNSSGYKGVSLDKRRNKWRAVIDVDGAQKHLGYFPSAWEARDAYARASVEYHGAFSRHSILAALEPVAQPEPEPWTPPEDRKDGYRCLGLTDDGWVGMTWLQMGQNDPAWFTDWYPERDDKPTAFAPMPWEPGTEPTPGQFTTMCLAIEDVVTGRVFDVDPWQPIETEPKDGESVLIWKPDERMVGEYMMAAYWDDRQGGYVPVGGVHKQGYYSETAGRDQGYPTHWMPLPKPPK